MMSRQRITMTGTAAVLLLALGACGSESGDTSGSDTSGGDGGFDVTTATLTDQPFCDRVDTAVVAGVLGMSPDQVKVLVERAVGDEFEGPNEEGQPLKSVANLCSYGSGTSQFLVSVQPDATADDVQQTIDDLASLSGKGSSETCEPTDGSAFGDPAGAFTCTSSPPVKRQRIVVTGLVGGSKFYCSAIVNQGAGADLGSATTEACRSTMEELASGA